jgi:hypothetical protein
MTILILVEHPDRELEVAKQMAEMLTHKYGCSVDVASILYHGHLCLQQRFSAVIIPSYKWSFVEFLVGWRPDLLVFCLNYEQMLSQFNREVFPPGGHSILNTVIHFSWSRDFSSFLIQNKVRNENIYHVSKFVYGIYTRDAYVNPVAEKYGALLNHYSSVVFAPLTDLQAFKSNKRLQREFRSRQAFDYAVLRRDYVLDSIVQIVRLLNTYAKENPGVLVVLRPHPSVGSNRYEELIRASKIERSSNFLLNYEFTAIDWVLVSNLVVSNYSSVLLDAGYFGRDVLVLEPITMPEFLKLPWIDAMPIARDCLGIAQAVRRVSGKDKVGAELRRGSSGIAEAVEVMGRLLTSNTNTSPRSGCRVNQLSSLLRLMPYVLKCTIRLVLFRYFSRVLREGLRRDFFEFDYR